MKEVWHARNGIVARGRIRIPAARICLPERGQGPQARLTRARGGTGCPRWPCLVAVAVCAFTAAGNDRFTAVGQ